MAASRLRYLNPAKLRDGVRYRLRVHRMLGPRVLAAFAAAYPDAFFVEIGANDGEEHDLLRRWVDRTAWRGILVEPVPWIFERLQRNRGGTDRLILENVALADREGRLPFYHPAPVADAEAEGLPRWYQGLGSFDRSTLLSHADHIPDIERRIVTTEVAVLTFDALCRRHGVSGVDLVAIDTEGHDWEILRHIDLRVWRPRLIVFEHYHLTRADRDAARAHLAAHGYETKEEYFDTYALDVSAEDELTRAFRRLRARVPAVSVHDDPTRTAPT